MTTLRDLRTASIPFTRTFIPEEARTAVDGVLASGWVTTGEQVMAFEQEFAAYVGAEHAVAVSSCTARTWSFVDHVATCNNVSCSANWLSLGTHVRVISAMSGRPTVTRSPRIWAQPICSASSTMIPSGPRT